jgi:hypothetical protein
VLEATWLVNPLEEALTLVEHLPVTV